MGIAVSLQRTDGWCVCVCTQGMAHRNVRGVRGACALRRTRKFRARFRRTMKLSRSSSNIVRTVPKLSATCRAESAQLRVSARTASVHRWSCAMASSRTDITTSLTKSRCGLDKASRSSLFSPTVVGEAFCGVAGFISAETRPSMACVASRSLDIIRCASASIFLAPRGGTSGMPARIAAPGSDIGSASAGAGVLGSATGTRSTLGLLSSTSILQLPLRIRATGRARNKGLLVNVQGTICKLVTLLKAPATNAKCYLLSFI
jgi:hypothetical protein